MDDIFGYKVSDSMYPQMKIVETPKFIFRPIEMEDAEDIFEYLSQDKVVKYLPFKAHKNLSKSKKFIQSYFINNYKKGKMGNYAIYYKPDKKVIGNVGFNNVSTRSKEGELGICLNPKYWGHNFSTELTCITTIISFEFSQVDKLVAMTYTDNKYTLRCLKNLHYNYVDTYRLKSNNEMCRKFELSRIEYSLMKKNYLPQLIKEFDKKIK